MELKQIKDLMSAMGKTGMKKLKIKREHFELELEKESPFPQNFSVPIEDISFQEVKKTRNAKADIPPSLHTPVEPKETDRKEEGKFVTSPMVGTFYTAATPEDPPFVKEGDKISANTVVCIIEAMKVMNEVKAGITGTIAEVLVENGHPVEFGAKLFRIT